MSDSGGGTSSAIDDFKRDVLRRIDVRPPLPQQPPPEPPRPAAATHPDPMTSSQTPPYPPQPYGPPGAPAFGAPGASPYGAPPPPFQHAPVPSAFGAPPPQLPSMSDGFQQAEVPLHVPTKGGGHIEDLWRRNEMFGQGGAMYAQVNRLAPQTHANIPCAGVLPQRITQPLTGEQFYEKFGGGKYRVTIFVVNATTNQSHAADYIELQFPGYPKVEGATSGNAPHTNGAPPGGPMYHPHTPMDTNVVGLVKDITHHHQTFASQELQQLRGEMTHQRTVEQQLRDELMNVTAQLQHYKANANQNHAIAETEAMRRLREEHREVVSENDRRHREALEEERRRSRETEDRIRSEWLQKLAEADLRHDRDLRDLMQKHDKEIDRERMDHRQRFDEIKAQSDARIQALEFVSKQREDDNERRRREDIDRMRDTQEREIKALMDSFQRERETMIRAHESERRQAEHSEKATGGAKEASFQMQRTVLEERAHAEKQRADRLQQEIDDVRAQLAEAQRPKSFAEMLEEVQRHAQLIGMGGDDDEGEAAAEPTSDKPDWRAILADKGGTLLATLPQVVGQFLAQAQRQQQMLQQQQQQQLPQAAGQASPQQRPIHMPQQRTQAARRRQVAADHGVPFHGPPPQWATNPQARDVGGGARPLSLSPTPPPPDPEPDKPKPIESVHVPLSTTPLYQPQPGVVPEAPSMLIASPPPPPATAGVLPPRQPPPPAPEPPPSHPQMEPATPNEPPAGPATGLDEQQTQSLHTLLDQFQMHIDASEPPKTLALQLVQTIGPDQAQALVQSFSPQQLLELTKQLRPESDVLSPLGKKYVREFWDEVTDLLTQPPGGS